MNTKNQIKKLLSLAIAVMVALALTATSFGAILQVQFSQNPSSNAQAGFSRMISESPPVSDTINGITVTANGNSMRDHLYSDGYLVIDHTDGDLDNLLSGGVLTNKDSGPITLTLADLADGTYSIETYHHSSYLNTGTAQFNVRLTDASGTDVLIHDNLVTSVDSPITTAEIATAVTTFRVGGGNDVMLSFTTTGHRLHFNGFVLDGGDPNNPSVDLGPDMITVSDLSVEMTPTVINNDTLDPQRDLTYEWSVSTGDYTVDFAPDEFVLAPTVTITNDIPNDPATVELTLSVNLEGRPPKKAVKKRMSIDVYSDACKATKATGTIELDSTDVNADCITGLADFAAMAETWLEDYTLTAPAPKP